jgi:hypothetical protein
MGARLSDNGSVGPRHTWRVLRNQTAAGASLRMKDEESLRQTCDTDMVTSHYIVDMLRIKYFHQIVHQASRIEHRGLVGFWLPE